MGKMVWVRNKPKNKAGVSGWWSEKKKIEALTTFLATGSQAHTSAITGIPEETIRTWRKSEWWAERTREFKSDNNIVLDNKLTKVMDRALDAVLDRLENGEFVFNPKTGVMERVPAKLRDVQRVASDVIDKKQLLERVTRNEKQDKQQITADHLILLAKEFAKFANGGREEPEVKDLHMVVEGQHHEVFESLGIETTDHELQKKVEEDGKAND